MSIANAQQYPCEWERITLVCERDGLQRGLDFCAQTARIYRAALLTTVRRGHKHSHYATLPGYRAGFIASYLDFRRFLHAHGRSLS